MIRVAAHLVAFAAAGYAVAQLTEARAAFQVFAWIVGAAIVHDLLFLPAYTVLDRAAQRVLPAARVPIVNHVRVVAVVSGALLLVYFPLILERATGNYERATGRAPAHYLGRWLAITAGVALVSALVWIVRVQRLDDAVSAPADEDPAGG